MSGVSGVFELIIVLFVTAIFILVVVMGKDGVQ